MFDKTWIEGVLGSDAGHPDPTRPGETATIGSVVQGFLDNRAGFPRDDVANYINEALQNEAGDLWGVHTTGTETVEAWEQRADQARTDFDAAGVMEATQKARAMFASMTSRYNAGRTDFGAAVRLAQQSKKVLLTPETCAWVVKLDHDGYVTEAMGVDVAAVFGANPDFDPAAAGPRGVKPLRAVDFAREAKPVAPVAPSTEAAPARTLSPAQARARQRDESREPVQAGAAVNDLVASLKQYDPRPVFGEEAPAKVAAEPELG